MTERDSLELLLKIRAEGEAQVAQLTRVVSLLEAADKRATESSKGLQDQTSKTSDSMTAAVLKAQLLGESIMRVAGAVKNYTVEAAKYAARTEQVSAVMDNLARVNGMNVQSVRQQANAIRDLGITTQESRNVINTMIGSQLDLNKALELTRMAQNAAKVAGISSSDALQRLVYAISSAQPEMLRTLGIQVSFENAYSKGAAAMGKNVDKLTEQERTQIRLNAVLARGPLIDGSYVMSLTTAAGQMQSLQRYTDELKNALGNGLQPALQDIIGGMERLNKFALNNVEGFQKMTAAATGLAVAGTVFAATPFLPTPARAAVAGAAGVGTYLAVDQDPVKSRVDAAREGFEKLEAQRKLKVNELKLGLIDKEAFDEFSAQLPKFKELLRAQLAESLAPIFAQRAAKLAAIPAPRRASGGRDKGLSLDNSATAAAERAAIGADIPAQYDLGGGVVLKRSDIEAIMNGGSMPFDKSGLVAKNPLMAPAAPDTETAAKLAARQRQFRTLLDGLTEKGLDPLARLLLDTQHKLRDMVTKYGPLTAAESAQATASLQGALGREGFKKKLEPVASDLSGDRFLYGWQRGTAQNVEVDPARTEATVTQFRERSVRAIQRYVSFQERMLQLTAGPGGEMSTIAAIADLRIKAAQDEFAISKRSIEDRARMEEAVDQAKKDRLLSIAAMQRAEIEQYRQAAGSIYDAMVQKGFSGIQDFIKGQLHVIGRTVFQNIAVEVFKSAKDSLKLGDMVGGQTDKDGKLTPLGRILRGTPLGVDQTKLATEMNTNETRMNTQAIKENTAAVRAGGAGAGPGGSPDAGLDAVTTGGKSAGKFQRMLGTAVAIGAGAYGVQQGIQQGGVKGALNAGAGVAGMLSGAISGKLLGASLASGPLAPVLAGVAMAVPLITSMFGQSKEKFDKQQTETLERNKYEAPTATNRVSDMRGADVDYDFRGRLRTASDRATVIQLNVSAMDVKSFLDRSGDIAEALHKELKMGHRVGLDIQQAILGT